MPSKAFERLNNRLRDIDDLMVAHDIAAIAGQPGERNLRGVNRASVVMLCAHFEGYVEDLFREAFVAIHPKLDPKIVVSRFHNPWPSEIDNLFSTIGLRQASKGIYWQSGASTEAVQTALHSLVETRNRIAHGATDISVWKKKVISYRRYVVGFAQRLDEKVALHIFSMTGRLPWPPADPEADATPLRRRAYIDSRRPAAVPRVRATTARRDADGLTLAEYLQIARKVCTPKQFEVLELREMYGYEPRHIAAMLGIQPGAVSSRLALADGNMAKALARTERKEEGSLF